MTYDTKLKHDSMWFLNYFFAECILMNAVRWRAHVIVCVSMYVLESADMCVCVVLVILDIRWLIAALQVRGKQANRKRGEGVGRGRRVDMPRPASIRKSANSTP